MTNRRAETQRENQMTEKIIGSEIEVHKALGPGLLESAYEEFNIPMSLLQNSLSFPKCSIGHMVSYNKTPDSRLNNAGMTIFLYFCKRLSSYSCPFVANCRF